MTAGPVVPRASKFNAMPPFAANGLLLTKASAPHRHASSASVKRKTTSFTGGGPASIARAVSSSVPTPAPSSLPPKETCTESSCANSTTVPVGADPGRTATTLRTRAIPYGPLNAPVPPTASWISGCSPRSVRAEAMWSRTAPAACDPAGCTCRPICSTCRYARSALNRSAGASRATTPGGDTARTVRYPRTVSRTSNTSPGIRDRTGGITGSSCLTVGHHTVLIMTKLAPSGRDTPPGPRRSP